MSDSRPGSSYGRYGYDSPYRYRDDEEPRPLSMPSYRIEDWGRDERPLSYPQSRFRHTDEDDRSSARHSDRLSSLIDLYDYGDDDAPRASTSSRWSRPPTSFSRGSEPGGSSSFRRESSFQLPPVTYGGRFSRGDNPSRPPISYQGRSSREDPTRPPISFHRSSGLRSRSEGPDSRRSIWGASSSSHSSTSRSIPLVLDTRDPLDRTRSSIGMVEHAGVTAQENRPATTMRMSPLSRDMVEAAGNEARRSRRKKDF